ncbi:MAG: hypothetical protein ACUVWP_03535 [bacterium]
MYEIEEENYERSIRRKRFFLFVILIVGFSILLCIYVNQYNKVVKLNYKIISITKEINDENLEKQRLNNLIKSKTMKVVEDETSGYRMPDVNNIIWIEEPIWLRFVR